MCIRTAREAHEMSLRWDKKLERLMSFMISLGGEEKDQEAVRQLLQQIKEFRDTHEIDVANTPLAVEAREQLADLGFQVESMIVKKMGIEFSDREEEMWQLVKESDQRESPFWILDAPARYGKTFMLFEVKRRLEGREWQVCYFSFKDYPGTENDPAEFLRQFRRTFDRQPLHTPASLDELRGQLVGKLGHLTTKLAIFIDDAELVREKKMTDWIRKLLDDIHRARSSKRFIGLVSGRYISPRWYEDLQVSPLFNQRLHIGYLGYQYTVEMIDSIAKQFGISGLRENTEAKAATVRIVLATGAGCPECSINLLIDIGLLTAFNPTRDFFDEKRRRELFEQHVKPVCQEVLADIRDDCTRTYFPYLCVLRRHNRFLLRDLVDFLQGGLVPAPAGGTSPELIEEMLNRTGLISYDVNRAFQGDDNIRQLFGLQMWLFDPEKAVRINDWAMRYFHKEITQRKNPGGAGVGYNREAFIEYLYHYALKLKCTAMRKEQILDAFRGEFEAEYLRLEKFVRQRKIDEYEWDGHRKHLLRTLGGDMEIRDQLADFGIDETEYTALCRLPE